ncbi:glutathione S-transferase family protein [Parvibaculum sp.]|uniref:glutathione S-transferase family protein n=1 Tax=Parvibaculum sp. TaxID=2024848 RepID=UPI00391A37A8
MKLVTGPLSMFGAKTQIAIAEKGIDCEIEMVPFSIQHRYSPLHPEVERLNPKRQVPLLFDGAVQIFDSTQIFEYIEHKFPSPALWPAGTAERAEARLLELKSDEVFFQDFKTLMSAAGNTQTPEARVAIENMQGYYRAMDDLLASREWLAGSYSYADIAFLCASWFASILGGAPGVEFRHVGDWRKRMIARPAVNQTMKEISAFLSRNGIPAPVI